ncbi:MAG TPA: hypothetical protein VFI52_06480 [Gemmatimonadaceae bacterium]|nr:hypothetical protein [Gemmatimonadaceae bacterium]
MSLASYRARTVGEIVDATFNLYRAKFATVVTVAMLVVAPPAIIKAAAPVEWQWIIELAGNLLSPVALGAIAAIVAAFVERDESLDVGDALRSTSGLIGSLIAVQVASGLMVLVGLVLLVVPGLIALAWTAVAVPVVMIERLGYSRAIDRSRTLARGRWGHVVGTMLLSWGLALLFMIGGGVIAGIVGRTGEILVELLFAVALPVPAIAMSLLYYDLRVRTESADLDAMISALPPTPAL